MSRVSCICKKNYEKLANKYPNNPDYRHTFFFFRSKLKHLCKYEEKKYRNKVLSELQAASDKNPKAFWDILNKMNRQNNSCNAYDEILPQDEFINFNK